MLRVRTTQLFLTVSALLFGATACAGSAPIASMASPAPLPVQADTGVVDVNGQGVVMVEPDRARILFAVNTEGPTAREAAARNAKMMEAAIEAVRDVGNVDVSTHGYTVQAIYARPDRDTGQRVISGYSASNTLQVTARRVADVGALIDAATEAGVNSISGLSFFSTDIEEARREALRMAVEDAQRQAETIADALGVPLGAVLEVRGGSAQPQNDMVMARMATMEAATPIEVGDQAVRASVSVRFRLGGE